MQKINSLNFYECAIIGTSQVFTYQAFESFNQFDIVLVSLKNTQKQAVILKKTTKPTYKCKDIIQKIYTPTKQEIEFIKFISTYYFTAIGEVISIFNFINLNKINNLKIDTKVKLNEIQNKALNFCKKNQMDIG